MKNNAIILLSCPDQKGIVATVSNFLFKNNGNIVDSNQYTDKYDNMFFMRVEWELSQFKLSINETKKGFQKIADKFHMKWELNLNKQKFKTAIFVSQWTHCLYEVLLKKESKELPIDIDLIISNHKSIKTIAQQFKINFFYFPISSSTKKEIEKKEIQLLKKRRINLILLARYMQILSENFISLYPSKIINIHHSFLPAFSGAKPYHQAFERGVKIIGATSHYATSNLDQGPIIEQDIIRVSHKDDISSLQNKGKFLEKKVFLRAIELHIENRILIYKNKTIIFD